MTFRVDVTPLGYKREQAILGYRKDENLTYRAAIQAAFLRTHGLVFKAWESGPVAIYGEAHGGSSDADNIFKEIADALNGLAFKDDRGAVQIALSLMDRKVDSKFTVSNKSDECFLVVHVVLMNGEVKCKSRSRKSDPKLKTR